MEISIVMLVSGIPGIQIGKNLCDLQEIDVVICALSGLPFKFADGPIEFVLFAEGFEI